MTRAAVESIGGRGGRSIRLFSSLGRYIPKILNQHIVGWTREGVACTSYCPWQKSLILVREKKVLGKNQKFQILPVTTKIPVIFLGNTFFLAPSAQPSVLSRFCSREEDDEDPKSCFKLPHNRIWISKLSIYTQTMYLLMRVKSLMSLKVWANLGLPKKFKIPICRTVFRKSY